MAKFHINSKGEAGACSAKTSAGCPFGGETEHYDSKEEAREAYESKTKTPAVVLKKTGDLEPIPEGLSFGEHELEDGRTVVINGLGGANWRSDCAQCERQGKGAFAPSHDAMPRCKSGQRPHCTCDACF